MIDAIVSAAEVVESVMQGVPLVMSHLKSKTGR
jgi:hypothetical protein